MPRAGPVPLQGVTQVPHQLSPLMFATVMTDYQHCSD
jgi:hypothetical protein